MPSFRHQHATHILSKYSRYFQNFQSSNPIFNSSHRYLHSHYKLHYASNRHFASKQQQSTKNQQPPTAPMPHHYATLNIDPNASIDDIKKSYSNLIKQWHPDLYTSKPAPQQQDAQQRFLLIRESYEIIINYKHSPKQSDTPTSGIAKPSRFAAAKRTTHPAYSYYSWAQKVYETQQTDTNKEEEEDTNEEEEEEEQEQKYSEYYKQNQTWIGKTMDELYDWIVFLYMRNPSWMQFFLIATACFGVVQCVWHLLYPNINDADPDRIWNVFKLKKNKVEDGYQPSMTGAMHSTPNLVALQPHFKGHTLYDNENRNAFETDEDYSDIEEDSALMMFAKLNLNSTVNRDLFKIGKKKKKESVDVDNMDVKGDVELIEVKEDVDRSSTWSKEVELKREGVEYNDIPLELRSSPMGVLLASYAVDKGDLRKMEENGQYDWSSVIERYRKLNEQNEKDLQTQ